MDDYGIGAAVGGLFNLGTTALQNKYNKEQAALQNQYNIDMWNRQNEYNSPASQMNRLKEAGLNPNLMYGQGSTGNASSAPTQVAPQKQAPEMAKLAEAFDVIALMSSLEGLKKQRIENNDARNRERQSFFEANMLEDYYNSRALVSSQLEQAAGIPFGDVTVSGKVPRGYRDTYLRPYSSLDTWRTNYLTTQELKKEYEDLGYQVDMSNFRKQMLAKDLKWYTYGKVLEGIGAGTGVLNSLTGGFGRILGGLGSFKKSKQKPNFHRSITNTYNRYNVYH